MTYIPHALSWFSLRDEGRVRIGKCSEQELCLLLKTLDDEIAASDQYDRNRKKEHPTDRKHVLHRHVLRIEYLPIVEINVVLNASSENRNNKQVFPTPESPIKSNLNNKSYVFFAIFKFLELNMAVWHPVLSCPYFN